MNIFFKKSAAMICAVIMAGSAVYIQNTEGAYDVSVSAAQTAGLTIADMPENYKFAADWIWTNRIQNEKSTERRNTIFDQIIAGKGTINFVVKWQSYKTITYEQRQQMEKLASDSINAWNDYLAGYENWPYDHIDVKITGWAVIDESSILDRHDDEIVYTSTIPYDSSYDTSNGTETIPDLEPVPPKELSRFEHFAETGYEYPGGPDKRFDMCLWATEGFPAIGGCGGDWGQRLSDTAYLNMLSGYGIHVLEHEIGHGFGITDFYGGEGEPDGFPPGGFPTSNGGSLMMAGSSSEITDFDGWLLRYMWSMIKDEPGRFDIESTVPDNPENDIRGDLNSDGNVNAQDLVLFTKYFTGVISDDYGIAADLNYDNLVNTVDYILLKNAVIGETVFPAPDKPELMESTVKNIETSISSQGDASLVVFYLDFPDCQYEKKYTSEELERIAFGSADESSVNYPFESMSAFCERSSKGAMNLTGKVFSYTCRKSAAYYATNKNELARECFEAFNDFVDFSQFDKNGDGQIDATLFTLPAAAGDDEWWPCAGPLGDDTYYVDGVKVGHIITGNADPVSITNFNSSYLHELGHCMGLPDYYLYTGNDTEGMHGPAGTELMDMDAFSDFSAVSKLLLGWYRENQVLTYDRSMGAAEFIIEDAQTDSGSCIVIPYNTNGQKYQGEYLVIEYQTFTKNNSRVNDISWSGFDPGVRVYHMSSEIEDNGFWKFFKYENTSEVNDGRRLIRLVNDGNGAFNTGSVIDSSVSGFGWYDSEGKETVDPGISITVGEISDGKCRISIATK